MLPEARWQGPYTSRLTARITLDLMNKEAKGNTKAGFFLVEVTRRRMT